MSGVDGGQRGHGHWTALRAHTRILTGLPVSPAASRPVHLCTC